MGEYFKVNRLAGENPTFFKRAFLRMVPNFGLKKVSKEIAKTNMSNRAKRIEQGNIIKEINEIENKAKTGEIKFDIDFGDVFHPIIFEIEKFKVHLSPAIFDGIKWQKEIWDNLFKEAIQSIPDKKYLQKNIYISKGEIFCCRSDEDNNKMYEALREKIGEKQAIDLFRTVADYTLTRYQIKEGYSEIANEYAKRLFGLALLGALLYKHDSFNLNKTLTTVFIEVQFPFELEGNQHLLSDISVPGLVIDYSPRNASKIFGAITKLKQSMRDNIIPEAKDLINLMDFIAKLN
ncbi:MAG: hypothetical protein NT030_05475 [Candidatus Saganbacteria bacterium]|nr:hypothetical protein [Candidatus Saganbacteria bacterium]